MPEGLHVKPEDVDAPEKRGNFTVSITGCNRQGVLYSAALAEAGFKVICADANQNVVKMLGKGKSTAVNSEIENKLKMLTKTGRFSATCEIKDAVAKSDIIILTNTAKIDEKKTPDFSEIEGTCKQVGTALRRGTLVIYGGIAGFGLTDGAIKENLENASGLKVGLDFGLAYNPTQTLQEETEEFINQEQLQIAANDKASLDSASIFLETITKKGVKKISNIKSAELASLFAIAQSETSLALANELAVFCENSGQNYLEIINLLDENKSCTKSVLPTISDENYRDAIYLLLASAENLNIKLRIPALARQTNEDMVKHAVNMTQDALRSCGKTLRRARIALLGKTKPHTSAYNLAKMLEAKGARTSVYDPKISENELADMAPFYKKTLNETVEGTDCIVVLTGSEQFRRINLKKLRAVVKTPAAIIDLAGIIDQEKAEKEEFVYRAIGKGAGKT